MFSSATEYPAAERWASLVMRAVNAQRDPRTLAAWAREAAVSTSTLRTCCGLVPVSPKRSLAFARLARALRVARDIDCHPKDLLDVRDPRTLRSLLHNAGFDNRNDAAAMVSFDEFASRQRFVSLDLARRVACLRRED